MNIALVGVTSRKFYLIFGIVATFLVGIAIDVLAQRGIDRDIASTLVLVPVIAALVAIFPEPLNVGKITILWAIAGIGLGLGFFEIKYSKTGASLQSLAGVAAYVYYIASVAIFQPLFEEIVVRKLLFLGAAKIVGPILSAIFVSILFALVHRDICVFAGAFSLVMCWMAWHGISTFNRTVLHGCYNLTITIILIVSGLSRVA